MPQEWHFPGGFARWGRRLSFVTACREWGARTLRLRYLIFSLPLDAMSDCEQDHSDVDDAPAPVIQVDVSKLNQLSPQVISKQVIGNHLDMLSADWSHRRRPLTLVRSHNLFMNTF